MSVDEKPSPNTRSKDKTRNSSQMVAVQENAEIPPSPATTPNAQQKNDIVPTATEEQESSSRASTPVQGPFGSSTKKEVYDSFQKWALKTYGDSAKTKTVTRKKSSRIMKILKGEEQSNSENSKFRFWVKSKGFRIGPPPLPVNADNQDSKQEIAEIEMELYVPCTKIGDSSLKAPSQLTTEVEELNIRFAVDSKSFTQEFGAAFRVQFLFHVITYKFLCVSSISCDHRGNQSDLFPFELDLKPFRNLEETLDETSLGSKQSAGESKDQVTYKKVAVVENFFDIIYDVHVEMDGRGGKHAGQKRTYKAIAETYAFLPREAVTRFLMSCADCQKRMHLGLETSSATPSPDEDTCATGLTSNGSSPDFRENDGASDARVAPDIDYSLPITTTYLKHMRSLGYSEEDALNPERGDCRSNAESESSGDCRVIREGNNGDSNRENNEADHQSNDEEPMDMTSTPEKTIRRKIIISRLHDKDQLGSNNKSLQELGMPNRLQSPIDDGAEDLSVGTKEDDDDDEDDECEKFDCQKHDPERLKAFNVGVPGLLVQNANLSTFRCLSDYSSMKTLDRMVPISKQPKEKIQAIIDSCQRQFPEFAGRSRKRIRTYLKSCRRNKRSRDQMGYEAARPTPPHLTSAIAEQILASACENEINNAKRMRLGLQPISTATVSNAELEANKTKVVLAPAPSTTPVALLNAKPVFQITTKLPSEPQRIVVQTPLTAKTTNPTPILLSSLVNGKTAVSANSMITYQPTTQLSTASLPNMNQQTSLINQSHASFNTMVVNGAADLRVKKSVTPQPKCPMNLSEITAVRQLISGYRESAAFLLRSADELEQLMLQQN
ncbi:Nucleolar protein 4 [Nymphon striatum]|nr:Nucleolar protein 4 [Nymphon striatum]